MVNKLTVASFSSPERDVRLDLFSGGVHVLREAGDLEDGFLVPRGRHDVGVRLLLNALDGRALRTHDQANHSVRDTDLRQAIRDGDALKVHEKWIRGPKMSQSPRGDTSMTSENFVGRHLSMVPEQF